MTLTATATAGFFFQSWTGDSPSATASTTFTITKNTPMTARFLPDRHRAGRRRWSATPAVQDDDGTPYLLHGGSLGPTVTATTLDELKMYLGSPDPYVVHVPGLIQGDRQRQDRLQQDAARHREPARTCRASSWR